jgi:hypothetical protein
MKTEEEWKEFERKLEVFAKIYEEMSEEEWEAILESVPEIEISGLDDDEVIAFGIKKPKDSIIYDKPNDTDTTH